MQKHLSSVDQDLLAILTQAIEKSCLTGESNTGESNAARLRRMTAEIVDMNLETNHFHSAGMTPAKKGNQNPSSIKPAGRSPYLAPPYSPDPVTKPSLKNRPDWQ